MNRMVSFAVAFFCISMIAASADAQQITVDVNKIDPDIVAQILKAQKEAAARKPIITADKAKEWADIGEGVAKAIAATAKALGTEVNEFVKTPVGKWAFFLVFWYVIGHKILVMVGGVVIWIVLGWILWRSFRIFHIPSRNEEKYVCYEFKSTDAKATSAVVHIGLFIVLSVVMTLIILL